MWNNRGKFNSKNFVGDIRLHIESAEDFTQLEEFYQKLKMINNLEIIFYIWSKTTGFAILVSLKDNIPLVDILGQMKMVAGAYRKTKKDIIVKLNMNYSEMISSIQKTLKKGILLA